ncbi:hypothetical protein [Synechococcus sp. ROS8604]|uniref:hypothetical protein n=1 Tax=Synechococcus sp. ROS8604 TaxID=1442557 RepID=UPI0016482F67|nr:hypothetical protein [Synechococcus sp. ROS8604]
MFLIPLFILNIMIWDFIQTNPLENLFSSVEANKQTPSISLSPFIPESKWDQWHEIGHYKNIRVYSTKIMAKLVSRSINTEEDPEKVVYQIQLEGTDVGTYEVHHWCKSSGTETLISIEHQLYSESPITTNYRHNYLEPTINILSKRFCSSHLTL